MREIFDKLINQRYSEIKEKSNGGDCNELVHESKSDIPKDFSAYKKPSDLYFSIKNSYTKVNETEGNKNILK